VPWRFGSDKKDCFSLGSLIGHELGSFFEKASVFLKIDDVDAVALTENVLVSSLDSSASFDVQSGRRPPKASFIVIDAK
jgi:hypothetical protein